VEAQARTVGTSGQHSTCNAADCHTSGMPRLLSMSWRLRARTLAMVMAHLLTICARARTPQEAPPGTRPPLRACATAMERCMARAAAPAAPARAVLGRASRPAVPLPRAPARPLAPRVGAWRARRGVAAGADEAAGASGTADDLAAVRALLASNAEQLEAVPPAVAATADPETGAAQTRMARLIEEERRLAQLEAQLAGAEQGLGVKERALLEQMLATQLATTSTSAQQQMRAQLEATEAEAAVRGPCEHCGMGCTLAVEAACFAPLPRLAAASRRAISPPGTSHRSRRARPAAPARLAVSRRSPKRPSRENPGQLRAHTPLSRRFARSSRRGARLPAASWSRRCLSGPRCGR